MRIAVFLSHPIQHFSPLWKAISKCPGVDLHVFYYAEQAVHESFDRHFGVKMKWDVDLLDGYKSEFLPRQWPTRDPCDCSARGLNRGIRDVLENSWDAAYIEGYAHINNWIVLLACTRRGIPVLYQSDSNILNEMGKGWLKLQFKKIVIPRFFRNVSIFLAVGDHNRDYLVHYGAPEERIRFCPIPVDTERFRISVDNMSGEERVALRKRFDISKQATVVGFCGKLRDIKQPDDLARAVAGLGREDIVALFIGSGELEQRVLDIGGHRVRVTGFINQKEIPRVLSLCDMLAMPSSR